MPYDEAQRFSSVYGSYDDFERKEETWFNDEAQLLGAIRRYLPDDRKLSLEGADAMAEKLGVLQGHLIEIDIAGRVMAEMNSAFLEGRAPKKQLSLGLSN